MSTIRLVDFHGNGRELEIDALHVTHWEPFEYLGRDGVRLHIGTGREILVAGTRLGVGNRITLAKDAALRQRANLTPSPVIVAAAKACMQQMAQPFPREELDLDLVTAVCTYLMEQAS